LLVAEFKEGDSQFQMLVAYRFDKGVLKSREVLLSTPTVSTPKSGPHVRYYLGKNHVHGKRYVISGNGNIIDIKARKALLAWGEDFVEAKGNALIFLKRTASSGRRYMQWNLGKEAWEPVEGGSPVPLPGLPSPGRMYFLDIERSGDSSKIFLNHPVKGRNLIVEDCGEGTNLSVYSSSSSNVPAFWLDDKTFLYARYKRREKAPVSDESFIASHASVGFCMVDIDKGISRTVAALDSVPPSIRNGSFTRDPEGKVIFRSGKQEYAIDFQKGKATRQAYRSMGNGFTVESVLPQTRGRIIKLEGHEIGQVWFRSDYAACTRGYIATAYGKVGSNYNFPAGIQVWNEIARSWTRIGIHHMANIIGWIED